MNTVFPGRYTAEVSEPVVVFLIGMRINRLRAIGKWLPVARAMGPMLQTLAENPDKGLLASHSYFRGWPLETCLVSYWRSFEDLTQFARDEGAPHFAAWQAFMKNVGSDESVGIWHETYQINPGQSECIYGNMPVHGLALATNHVRISERTRSASKRMAVTTNK